MDDLKALAALTALNEMFASSHFSICTIDKVATLLGVHPQRDAYNTLRTLHCVDWNRMPRQLRDSVPQLVQQALADGSTPVQFELKREANQALQVLDQSKYTRRPLLQRLFSS